MRVLLIVEGGSQHFPKTVYMVYEWPLTVNDPICKYCEYDFYKILNSLKQRGRIHKTHNSCKTVSL